MPQLDDLLAQIHRPATARCQIDRPDRHLCREAERVSGRGTVRHDGFAALEREGFDGLLDGGRADAEPTRNRAQIDAAPGTHQPATFSQSRQGLIHRGAIAEMEQALRRDRSALGQALGVRQNLFGQSLHGTSPVRNICGFLTVFNLPQTDWKGQRLRGGLEGKAFPCGRAQGLGRPLLRGDPATPSLE